MFAIMISLDREDSDVMYKSFKFRIYPDKEQLQLINKSFGCTRFVYNHYLSKIKENEYSNAYSNISDYVNNLKYEYIFLQEIDSTLIRKTLFHLDDNLKKYYNNGFGYPKYKSKFDKNSYTTSAIYKNYKDKVYCNIELDLINKRIKLPKLKWIDIRGYRNLECINDKIVNATISREKYEKRIKRIQRELSRKVKRSNNYYKCKKKLAILYNKLKNARNYYLHNITKKITDEYDIITCEKLTIQKMLSKKELSKKISDASFYEIIRQLAYKCRYKGKVFYQIDPYYPSSQKCNICGNIDKKYKNLNEREYKCSKCHHEIDWDINASINIMYEGLKLYMKEVQI